MSLVNTTTESTVRFSASCHPACIACRPRGLGGLGLSFESQADGSVVATFACEAGFQGYPDRVHGGVLATLVDAAMTHCLFARRIAGYTVKLEIRYRRGVRLGVPAQVRAWLGESRLVLHYLHAEVWQDGERCVTAQATFMGNDER